VRRLQDLVVAEDLVRRSLVQHGPRLST
jgi:hypothetical protein